MTYDANQLKFVKVANAAVHHYIYDAQGERTFKGQGSVVEFRVNGSNVLRYRLDMMPYTTYASGQLVVNPSGLATLHYYSGSERIASRLVGAVAPLLSTNLPITSSFQTLQQSTQVKELILYAADQGWGLGNSTLASASLQLVLLILLESHITNKVCFGFYVQYQNLMGAVFSS